MQDEHPTQSSSICIFQSDNGVRCAERTDGIHDYCPTHMRQLVSEVRRAVYQILYAELGADPDEIKDNMHIMVDLGADSLDLPALLFIFEDTFGVDLPTDIPGEMYWVGRSISYITDLLLKEKKFFFFEKASFAPQEHSDVQNERNVDRTLGVAAGGDLFQEYYEKLGLSAEEVGKLFKMVMRHDRIYHVTTAPKDDSDPLKLVHVFFLGENRLYYFKLKPDSVTFQSASLNELRLAYKTEFGSDGKISKITVWSEASSTDVDEGDGGGKKMDGGEKNIYDQKLVFQKAAGVEGALAFLTKYLSNLEGDR
jgi:acyl carrier protein